MTRTTRKGGQPVGDRHAARAARAASARTSPGRGTSTGATSTAATPVRAASASGAASSSAPVRVRDRGLPRWLVPLSLALAVIGLLASLYLTYEHLTAGATLACPEGQVVNCAKVTGSTYSSLLGIPVVYPGLAFFVALVALCLPAPWRRAALDLPRVALAAAGVAMVAYLVWAEVQLGAICLWCTVVHVVTLALFFALVFGKALTPSRR
ncbi:vitamin K epoxide reductase family protein [Arsenicicoccus dermatophilus]|uniref:vitamin K epoxide reductase family protein n=1 Tax=Arsenicicoccus dermatophilus TaxID=1076331 RepID=UPI001F4C7325|nr:vitamin K epoxide reductase family protein [Arsenicicoccus dermatophilus]MCH8613419.1 vitamin K epoxide reductase family protein [Arsenicicoccus dermatophilus]